MLIDFGEIQINLASWGYKKEEIDFCTLAGYEVAKYGNELREQREWSRIRAIVAATHNTVAKESITPIKVMSLPFIDTKIESTVIRIQSEKEARLLLKELRGF